MRRSGLEGPSHNRSRLLYALSLAGLARLAAATRNEAHEVAVEHPVETAEKDGTARKTLKLEEGGVYLVRASAGAEAVSRKLAVVR